ncbi:zinc finger protein 862-like [Ptychodera flava]|uniref:zinc finger protein 862-like n=1 Tax=Ptychodera flava TaxID=63121 RepID=UPI00396A31D7
MGLGSDGAPIMTGRHNSVGVRLKHQNVYLISVHCAAHRLALAAADASRGVKKVTKYKKTVDNIFNFFKYSATRYKRLRELNKILESEDVLSLKEPCSVRWLSFGRAVKGIYDNWPALVMEFDEEAAQRDNTVAGGLLKQIKQYSFSAITHLLMDVLQIMDRCNLVFQRKDVNLATVEPMVQSTIASLQLLLEPDSLGEHESKLTREIENNVYRGHSLTHVAANHIEGYANVRWDFITYLIKRLRARFTSERTDLLTCLDASKYADRDVEIRDYGTESLATLIAYFGANRVEDGVPMVAPIHGPDLQA